MYCPNCGAKIPDNNKFCTECGKPVRSVASPPQMNAKKKNSPVLAILLVLTIPMTALTGWYFLINQSVSDILRADTAGDEAVVNQPEDEAIVNPAEVEAPNEESVSEISEGKAQEETAQEDKEKVEAEFDTVFQTSKTPSNVAKLGSREKLPSGEVVATLSDGNKARNVWGEDEDGNLFYFGYDGCLVKNNYAPDGFYAGEDGALDRSVARITESEGGALLDKEFVTDTSNDPMILLQEDPDNRYEFIFIKRYSFGYDEVFGAVSDQDSDHAFLLNPDTETKVDFDSTKGALLTMLDGGKTMIVSDCGVTETYHVNDD